MDFELFEARAVFVSLGAAVPLAVDFAFADFDFVDLALVDLAFVDFVALALAADFDFVVFFAAFVVDFAFVDLVAVFEAVLVFVARALRVFVAFVVDFFVARALVFRAFGVVFLLVFRAFVAISTSVPSFAADPRRAVVNRSFS